MGYGRFVGRVGALAVALGVGVAVPAVAGADSGDGSSPAGTSKSSDTGAKGSDSSGGATSSDGTDAAKDGDDTESDGDSPSEDGDGDDSEQSGDTEAAEEDDSPAPDPTPSDDVDAEPQPADGARSERTRNKTTTADESAVARADSPVASPSDTVTPRPSKVAEKPTVTSATAVPASTPAPEPSPAPMPEATVPVTALDVLPATPVAPSVPTGAPVMELLWAAHRRTESTDATGDVMAANQSMAAQQAAALAPAPASVTYRVNDDWGAGFVAAATVTAGPSGLNGWTVEFDTPAQITNIWNAELVSRVGNHTVIRNAPWNGQLGAGQSAEFGFQATPGGASSAVSNIVVNGVPVGGPPPPAPPSVAIADASVVEGNGGTATLSFVVSLSKVSSTPVTVAYATSNGTATAGADYVAKTGTVTFAPGVLTQQVQVSVTGDAVVEANETLTVTLSAPSGATIGDGTAIGTITNDDVAPAPTGAAATFTKTDDWGQGFTGNVTLTAGQSGLNGWTVEFDSPAQITNIWNAEIVSRTGNRYVVRNAPYNGQVAAGQTTSFGFQGTPGGASATATNFVVNGVTTPPPPPPAPSVAIADAAVAEGNSGTRTLSFGVSLSRASTTPVTVGYTTSNGTATAGVDYVASSGTVTFAPGVTTQQVQVTVAGDTVVESNETLTVTLASPSGATIADGTAIGTITNDDAGPLPSLSIADVSVLEGIAGSGAVAPGFLSTRGNQIVDSAGNPVQLAGVNWFGAESETLVPHGLWTRNYKDMIDQMAALEFNTIRLPYSNEMVRTTRAPSGIDYSKNPDLQGLTALQVMDKIIGYAGEKGMKVILDNHRSSIGAGPNANGLWYEGSYTEAGWIADWQFMANRYKDNSTVIGADLFNEPHNGTWGGGGATDWAAAAERAGNAVLAINPNMLIFVEGVETYQGDSYWWGGNLQGVKDRPIVLNVANRVVYSPHDYPNSVFPQPFFQQPNFGAALPDLFEKNWGYIYEQNIAPIYIGEFGTRLTDPKDVIWYEAITSYISGDFDNDGDIDIPAGTEDMSWTYWSWNPNSLDTGGILADDWRTVNQSKLVYLEPIQFDFDSDGGGSSSAALFVVTLSNAYTDSVTVQYATANGTATAGSDYVGSSGTLTFAPGETSKTIVILVNGDTLMEGNESFTVQLSNPSRATVADGTGIGTIIDNMDGHDHGGDPGDGGHEHGGDPGGGQDPGVGQYVDLASFGHFHGSDHTGDNALEGSRTAITTEALVAYNDMRHFAGLDAATLEDVGRWSFANGLTNNAQPSGNDLQGVGLYYAMQGAKVGWFADDKFDPQIVADIERTARLGSAASVIAMVEQYGHEGYAEYLVEFDKAEAFVNTLKMEPHYAGWMHDRAHGGLSIEGVATAHDVNHLTVLSHDQLRPFMNDTWDYPQHPALLVSHSGVLEYFQAMVVLGNPRGQNMEDLPTAHVHG